MATLLDLFFPAQCAACGEIGSGLCERCAAHATDMAEWRGTLLVRALGAYDGALRRAILALKDGRRDVARALGFRTSRLVPDDVTIVPVPTTKARIRVRGFDGVYELARVAAPRRGVLVRAALEQSAGDAQRGRSRSERLSARNRFTCNQRFAGDRIVLIDDVCTTGATLLDCAAALRACGADVVGAVVVALAPNVAAQ